LLVRRQRWKGKESCAHFLCHSTPVRTCSLTLYTCQRQFPWRPFRTLLSPSILPPIPSVVEVQPASDAAIIGLANRRGSPRGRWSVVSGCASPSPSPSPFSPPPNRIVLWRAHSDAVIASAYSASPFRVKVSALSPSAPPIRRWTVITPRICSTETY